jgi:hypothetical protein
VRFHPSGRAAATAFALLLAIPGVAHAADTSGAASLTVTAGAGVNASTYNPGSFVVANLSSQGVLILRVRIGLSTALIPDLLFDPLGQAGDTVAKCLTSDSNPSLVGLVPPADPCASPFSGARDGGYEVLTLDFADFRPNRTYSFSVDVDPTIIRGSEAPGPSESGSVSGLEMTGATVEFTFSDQAVLTAPLFPIPGDDGGATATAQAGAISAPGIALLGVPSLPATVAAASQTMRLSGPPGWHVRWLRAEGTLDTTGLPGNGFDVEPFEANTVVQVEQGTVTLGANGIADVPIVLTRGGPGAGLNHLAAALEVVTGRTGPLAPILVAVPESCSDAPPRAPQLSLDGAEVLWSPLPGATTYDVVRGDLPTLRSTHGRYDLAITGCPGFQVAATSLQDAGVPPVGGGWFYLSRGRSCGGAGTYDDASGWGQSAPRDAGIDSAPSSCP